MPDSSGGDPTVLSALRSLSMPDTGWCSHLSHLRPVNDDWEVVLFRVRDRCLIVSGLHDCTVETNREGVFRKFHLNSLLSPTQEQQNSKTIYVHKGDFEEATGGFSLSEFASADLLVRINIAGVIGASRALLIFVDGTGDQWELYDLLWCGKDLSALRLKEQTKGVSLTIIGDAEPLGDEFNNILAQDYWITDSESEGREVLVPERTEGRLLTIAEQAGMVARVASVARISLSGCEPRFADFLRKHLPKRPKTSGFRWDGRVQ